MISFGLRRNTPTSLAGFARISATQTRSYNFASKDFDKCLELGVPSHDGAKLRKKTVEYLAAFDKQSWYTDPIHTVIKGKSYTAGTHGVTKDSFMRENGAIIEATSAEVDAVIEHMKSYKPPKTDFRQEVRAVEAEILADYDAFLVGNQAMDFFKQDGITEIEESVQANVVEQRLNDLLFQHEQEGAISISRVPAYVGCVSNFSNFLDLFRKSLRNLELGVPVVIFSRSHTTQHMFRWAQMLISLCEKHGIDSGMVTYLSASIKEQQRTVESGDKTCPMYYTCSREIAKTLKRFHGPVIASTGGPNTLVATKLTPAVSNAIRLSASIENAGQCTALRHAVVPCTEAESKNIFDGIPVINDVTEALNGNQFAGIFNFSGSVFQLEKGYNKHSENPLVAYKHSSSLPGPGIDEHWRNVYADVTSPPGGADEITSDAFVSKLSRWLVDNQPITLATNNVPGDFALAQKLFEQTGQVVYTVGSLDEPALTCQARPQEGEVFGEFPVRREMADYTKYPVVVPSPTPAYNSQYQEKWLEAKGSETELSSWLSTAPSTAAALVAGVQSAKVRGYLRATHEYLSDALQSNPKPGRGARTALYGLQTTPLNGQLNFIRCGASTTVDDLAPYLFPFLVTSASNLVRVSVAPSNTALSAALAKHGIQTAVEDDSTFTSSASDAYNVIHAESAVAGRSEFPLAGQFISLLFCVGHIKSGRGTEGGKVPDQQFVEAFKSSPKWLKMA